MEQQPLSYYQKNKDKLKARYAEKRDALIAYQLDYYEDNRERILEKQIDYNATHYRRHREEILLKKSQKVCCLNCRRVVALRQMTKHLTTRIVCLIKYKFNHTISYYPINRCFRSPSYINANNLNQICSNLCIPTPFHLQQF